MSDHHEYQNSVTLDFVEVTVVQVTRNNEVNFIELEFF